MDAYQAHAIDYATLLLVLILLQAEQTSNTARSGKSVFDASYKDSLAFIAFLNAPPGSILISMKVARVFVRTQYACHSLSSVHSIPIIVHRIPAGVVHVHRRRISLFARTPIPLMTIVISAVPMDLLVRGLHP